ncbi:MAG TPA: hypothetical protein PK668_07825 [Myxococcota bacterium]|nr:hypothetical protein [Myxococcota bacterium]HRY93118.1 hypothetical protein [Myxococcota bacterium]
MASARQVRTGGRAAGWLALALLVGGSAGCGSEVSEVRLDLQEDGSSPCMGAAHLVFQVLSSTGVKEFHEFGEFFRADTSACVSGEFRFEGLDFSSSVQLAVKVYDSTVDDLGILAMGTSQPLDIHAGSPTMQLVVTLARTDARLGTIRIRTAPADFYQYANIDHLLFSVTPEGEVAPLRSGYFAFAPERALDPFPLLVSNLPVPAITTQMNVRVDAQDAASQPVHTWTGAAYLGGAATNPADVLLQ